MDELTYADLIYLFLDGEISPLQQKMLFTALIENPDLQTELQQAVEINTSIRKNKENIYPSADLSSKVFSQAGICSTVSFTKTSTGLFSYLTKYSAIIKSISIPLVSAAFGSLITTLLFINIFNNNSNINNNNFANDNKKTQNKEYLYSNNNQKLTGNINVDTQKNNISKNSNINTEKNIINNRKFFNHPTGNINSEELNTNNESLAFSNNNQSSFISLDNINTDKSYEKINHSLINTFAYNHLDNIKNNRFEADYKHVTNDINVNKRRLALEVKGISNLQYLPNRSIESEKLPIINNFGISAFYEFDDNHTVSVKYTNESLQMYSLEYIGDNIRFNKEPRLNWFGVGYKYSFDKLPIFNSLYPYAELDMGATKFGPMGKAVLGLTYNPENIFSFSIGLESSMLMYKINNNLETTEKFSIIYNVGIYIN